MKKLAIAVLACCAFAAQAASSVGMLDAVDGNVSVGGGQGGVVQGKIGMPLVEGSTVLVSSKGTATVVLENGCRISLVGSQSYTVNSKQSCELAIASVKSLGGAPLGTGIGGGTGFAGGNLGPAVGFTAVGLAIVLSNNNSGTKASGS